MNKIKKQYQELEPIIHDYWVNKQMGSFSILKNDRLKNPIEMLPVLLQRFVDQKEHFSNFVPSNPPTKDIGMLRVDFSEVKDAL